LPSDPKPANELLPLGGLRSTRPGDLPEPLRRRYFLEDRGREVRLFLDATSRSPSIEDRGRRLISRRSDPNAVRDMVLIAQHRGWKALDARGARSFRREAWLAGRGAGLEVRGYQPSARDLQELERRSAARTRATYRGPEPAADRLDVVGAVVRRRVADPETQARLMTNARARVAAWLERGAKFAPWHGPIEADRSGPGRERRRAR
jgi:hypothetical protein